MKISFNDHSWQCPRCLKRRLVRDTGTMKRLIKCCGVLYEVVLKVDDFAYHRLGAGFSALKIKSVRVAQ